MTGTAWTIFQGSTPEPMQVEILGVLRGARGPGQDLILAKLHGDGMTVTGDNPWDIETHQADVKLRAVWDGKTQVLKLIVASSAAWAPCSVIWDRIEPKLREVIGV